MKSVSERELREHIAEHLDGSEPVVVTMDGRNAGVLFPMAELPRLLLQWPNVFPVLQLAPSRNDGEGGPLELYDLPNFLRKTHGHARCAELSFSIAECPDDVGF